MIQRTAHSIVAILAKVELDAVPQLGLEVAGDHRAAAREVDQLDLCDRAVVRRRGPLVRQAVAVVAAAVARGAFLARDGDAVQLSALAPLGFLARRIGSSATLSPPKIFARMFIRPLRGPRMRELMRAAGLRNGALPMSQHDDADGGKGRWEGSLHRRPERPSLPQI